MRCQKCGYISWDDVVECQQCRADLSKTRAALGVFYTPLTTDWDSFFLAAATTVVTAKKKVASTVTLDLDEGADDFEFHLD